MLTPEHPRYVLAERIDRQQIDVETDGCYARDTYVYMPWRKEAWHDEPWKRNPAIVKLAKPYWSARKRYDELESRFIAADTAGLLDAVQKFYEHAKKFKQDVRAAFNDR